MPANSQVRLILFEHHVRRQYDKGMLLLQWHSSNQIVGTSQRIKMYQCIFTVAVATSKRLGSVFGVFSLKHILLALALDFQAALGHKDISMPRQRFWPIFLLLKNSGFIEPNEEKT